MEIGEPDIYVSVPEIRLDPVTRIRLAIYRLGECRRGETTPLSSLLSLLTEDEISYLESWEGGGQTHTSMSEAVSGQMVTLEEPHVTHGACVGLHPYIHKASTR